MNDLLEKSAMAGRDGDAGAALELAEECCKLERRLQRARESASLEGNVELAFATQLNLAHRQHLRGMHAEAIETYGAIVKNRAFANGGRLPVNMGNVYYEQGKYPAAIKMYRMALDQITAASKETRFKITRNIACAFLRMGQYVDAAQTFSDVMENEPDLTSGFNLVVCYYATGDVEKMKRAFVSLLALRAYEPDDEDGTGGGGVDDDVLADDGLRAELRRRQIAAHNKIMMAAKLIGPKVGKTPERGYEYLADEMHRAGYASLANELEMEKALGHLKAKTNVPANFEEGKRCLREFEKKEHSLKAKAATNPLSCITRRATWRTPPRTQSYPSRATGTTPARSSTRVIACGRRGTSPGRATSFATPPTWRRIASRPFTTSDSRTKTWARTPRRSGRFERFTRCFRISTRRCFSSETSRI